MPLPTRRSLFLLIPLVAWQCVASPHPVPAPVASSATAVPTQAREVRFVVLHTNDVHGQVLTRKATWISREDPPQVGGLARAAAYVNAVREETRREGQQLIVVDAGDWYQGTPEGLVDRGLPFVQALAEIRYDALCVGNHELDHGIPNLLRILKESDVPAICANLHPKGRKERVDWVWPYRLIERAGIRIALVGLLTPATPEITHADAGSLDFHEPVEELRAVERELEGKTDWILPVTHLGVDGDKVLARAFPEVPLIVGGHSHTLLKEGAREGATLIVQAGTKISVVGRVDLLVRVPASDEADRELRVLESRARLVDLLAEPEEAYRNTALETRCASLEERTKEHMDAVVGELAAPASRSKDPVGSGSAGNLIADVLRERAQAEVGVMNRGGIRTDLDAGPLTRREVFEIMPFDNTLVSVDLTGEELFEFLRRAVEGAAHSGLEVSGLVVRVQGRAAGERKLVGLDVGGEPLAKERVYRVAMNSFMADGGDAYLDKDAHVARKDTGLVIRDVLEEAFAARSPLTPPMENRYAVEGP